VALACAAESGPGAIGDAGTGTDGGPTSDTADPGSTGDPTDGGPALPPRPDTRYCRFDGWAPGLLAPLTVEPAFDEPVPGATAIAVDVDAGLVFVGTDDGRLLTLLEGAPAVEAWPASGEEVTGLAVDPQRGHVYVRVEQSGPSTAVRRFSYDAVGVVDPVSLVRVLFDGHPEGVRVGSGLAFQPPANLVIPLADGAEGEEQGPAQERTDARGSVLRLDVGNLVSDYATAVPADNPWADEPSPASEAWAIGVRDPAGCSVDPSDGALWCFDVGVGASEVTPTFAGANLGWPYADGPDCLLPTGDCYQFAIEAPTGVYRHGDDDCGTAVGAIARGEGALDGVAVFGDRCSGQIWAADAARMGLVGVWDPPPAAFTNDVDGTVWTVDADGGVGRVVVVPAEGEFPLRLSDSGCFDDLPALASAPDLIPYELNSPLWTDAAHKQRWIVLPPGEQIHAADDGELTYPVGTAILKMFAFEGPVETRVMIRRELGWEFHTYEWNEEGTDAELLDERKQVMLKLPGQTLRYDYPSRAECGYCHGTANAKPLGPRLDQLAREVDYGGTVADQLDALVAIGAFDGGLPEVVPMASPSDEDAPLRARARAYLHSQCGHCHRPGGWVPPQLEMDLRWSTPTADAEICDEELQYFNPWVPVEFRIAPGDPENSAIWMRQTVRGLGQMPPLSTYETDPNAQVVRDWIAGLEACPD
jgi:uncharacterized repeat protein (TIGR03806 family)